MGLLANRRKGGKTMEITSQLSLEDYRSVLKIYQNKISKESKRAKILSFILLGVLLCLCVIVMIAKMYFLLGVYMSLFFCLIYSIYSAPKRAAKKYYQEKMNQNAFQKVSLTFSENGVEAITDGIQSTISWESFPRIYETTAYFMMFQTKNSMNIIKKVDFTEEQLQEFRELIDHNYANEYKYLDL